MNQHISRNGCSAETNDSRAHVYTLSSICDDHQIVDANTTKKFRNDLKSNFLQPNDCKEACSPTVVQNSIAEANMNKKPNVFMKKTSIHSIQESFFNTSKYPVEMVNTNGTARTSTNTNAYNEAPVKDSNWLLQHNPGDGQPVYVNLRTGNTSGIIPCFKPEPEYFAPQNPTVTDWCKLRPFRKFPSHLSHKFTPGLPRDTRLPSAEDKRTSEVSDMLDQWVNPVFHRNEKVKQRQIRLFFLCC